MFAIVDGNMGQHNSKLVGYHPNTRIKGIKYAITRSIVLAYIIHMNVRFIKNVVSNEE